MRIVIVDGGTADCHVTERAVISMNSKSICEDNTENAERADGNRTPYEIAGTAGDGKAGYELIRAVKPDLVITDVRLAEMSGLEMVARLRKEKAVFRVIVLTGERDFDTAREAIRLGVDDYLLKPVKPEQVQKAVKNIENKLADETARESGLSAESIFSGCLNGQIHSDERLQTLLKERYGFTLEDPGALFVIWIGSGYMEQREKVHKLVNNAAAGSGFSVCAIPVDAWHIIAVTVYRKKYADDSGCARGKADFEDEYSVFRESIVPAVSKSVRGEIICLWQETEHMKDMPECLRDLRRIREWNLIFDRGDIIRAKDVEALAVVPLKYPAELENQVRQAVLASNGEEIKKSYYRLYDIFRREIHSPRDIKECLIRFNMSVLAAYKMRHELRSEMEIQYSMQSIADAMSWGGIRVAMERFLDVLHFDAFEEVGDSELSPMIRKAVQLVRKYYDQGITLEEIAQRLFVSEEYLSTQFKKETGRGFAETVRELRIERIKGLLVNTRLKLNQIAELTGYTDPKYMSKVFKEEVGMLPTEFRKISY